MHIVIFGLSISSSWGNGHATLWRSLVKSMLGRGHTVTFYERDVPYYANTRDLWELPTGGKLRLYEELDEIRAEVRAELGHADLALCTSYCADGPAACDLILESRAEVKAFYDLDTPVTLDGLSSGKAIDYIPRRGLGDFDLVLSFTGGRALEELRSRLGAKFVAPLYGSVDPETHARVPGMEEFRAALSYLGTYATDRQDGVNELLLEPARRMPEKRFLIGGAQYPEGFPWAKNISFVRHLPPSLHAAFFCSGRATLNVTRRAMAAYGYCPSGRLFEAAACGVPILTDCWAGLGEFFALGSEVLPVRNAGDVMAALALSDDELRAIGDAGRERTLTEHTGEHRVRQLEGLCESVRHVSGREAVA